MARRPPRRRAASALPPGLPRRSIVLAINLGVF
jgi:hypothetical protein